MELWQIAGLVFGALVTFLAFSFGVVWKLMQEVKKSVHSRINLLERTVDHVQKDCISSASIKYVNDTFVRKDMHTLEYTTLLNKIEELAKKMDTFIKECKK